MSMPKLYDYTVVRRQWKLQVLQAVGGVFLLFMWVSFFGTTASENGTGGVYWIVYIPILVSYIIAFNQAPESVVRWRGMRRDLLDIGIYSKVK